MDTSVINQAAIVPRYGLGRRIVSFKKDPLGHFEGHYNKRKKIMIVSEEIMRKVEEAENDDRDFNRCIAVQICPKCGNRLNCGITHTLRKSFACSSNICEFRYLGY